MSATPKQRRKWIFILSALSCLAAVFYGLDGLALKQDQESSTFGQFKLFTEVMSVVRENYVQNLETEQLIQGAMKGMISQLDPHSSVLTPEEFKEMQSKERVVLQALGWSSRSRTVFLPSFRP